MTHLWAASLLIVVYICNSVSGGEYDRALFVKYDDIRKAREIHSKVSQVSPNSMDQTVDHILMWLQSRYQNQQNQRQARQDSDQQRPRPFTMTQPQEYRGYLPPQPPPQPEFPIPSTSQLPPSSGSPFFLTATPDQNQTPPSQVVTQPPPIPVSTDSPIRPADYSSQSQQTQQPSTDDLPTGFPVTNPPFVSESDDQLQQSNPNDLQQPNLINLQQSNPNDLQQSNPNDVSQQSNPNGAQQSNPSDVLQSSPNDVQSNPNDALHPPHIHQMNVQCSKDSMTIDVEFNKPYDGVVYSKGFYNNPECRYVNPNSGQTKYSFRVMLNSCGTHFVDEFSTGKQAYLENVLVVQNEPGIQEVWDVIRTVRCLWEGNLNKALSIALNIGMLNQEVVTFSGDTATARLDIQAGKGPFAPIASGLVKIGETMTLVVTVDGDPGFNILVRDCVARDNDPDSGNQLQLTDARGCVAKPKLFGSFQTTTNPATGSLIAYAYFQAFKFPDVMDLLIECNVELCKVNCEPCTESNQKIDPGRKRRDVPANNTTNAFDDGSSDSMTLVGRVHVYSPDDLLADNFNHTDFLDTFQALTTGDRTLCISSTKFYMTYSFMVAATLISSGMSLVLWVRLQRKIYKQ
ncbi:Zona pellucida domain [Cinara cedri]|uniref:Zona pellucida domain n=1 Tax=Cinara cedri TaxID=506608 RepID=A0A5E4MTW6_9HEMI|nr:Zona pellucida domain [Cinara cedri]